MDYEAYSSYHAVDLQARTARASPVQLVLILMDGLMAEIARARAHITALRYERKAASLNKCVEILNGLSSALDLDAGGEVVQNLHRLYDYCAWRLNQAGLKLDVSALDEVARLLEPLRSGWLGVQAKHES